MALAVTDEQLATLRALLSGEVEKYRGLFDRLDRRAAQDGYTALIAAGFFEAVDRKFSTGYEYADIIDFVGRLRAQSDAAAEDVDPHAAELLIRHSLGEDVPVDEIDTKTMVSAQTRVLGRVVQEEGMSGAELDSFLADVRQLADNWLGREQEQ
ncbi:hypothetical protein [Allonocardiopsis opalescens]|uniref:Uncharacterized protein n=1 Tax=Allonocardiopsis opalescens TaxID=1144618 RepID=A0A2T0QE02_9ACTN|nr:hypothetical protein [Allonocardiopsis opalescens]PRY02138.1 hypothetical protein CLV72_101738 [Allonocardiopsis opalescens]